jgi:hypothetical protein
VAKELVHACTDQRVRVQVHLENSSVKRENSSAKGRRRH